jgi:multidrug efflux pump subunit AcrB
VLGTVRGAPDISFDAISERVNAAARIAMKDPGVDTVDYWVGPNPTMSDARIILNLKPLDQRKDNADTILSRIGKQIAGLQGVISGMQVRQDIQIGARPGLAQYQYTLQDGDVAELYRWATILQTKFAQLPELQNVSSDKQASATSLTLEIDRMTASRLGVHAQDIDNTLYDAFGQRQVATIFDPLSQYYVIEEVSPRDQLNAEALSHLYVRSSDTQALIPLSLLVHVNRAWRR